MHSSRMRTVHNSSHLHGGGGVPSPGGCTWARGVYLVPGGYLVLEGVPGPEGCTWSWGGGTCPSTPLPPWTDRQV